MKQNHELLMVSLGRFYSDPENMRTVVEITEGRSDISLRMIDWFITNYAKKKSIIHMRTAGPRSRPAPASPVARAASDARGAHALAPPQPLPPDRGPDKVSFFSVYLSYRDELRTYSKQQFDPFRRNEHIVFRYGDGGEIETTVGQLNFFRWAIENGIVDYISEHKAEIEAAMLSKAARPTGAGEDAEPRAGAADETPGGKGKAEAPTACAPTGGDDCGGPTDRLPGRGARARRVAPVVLARRSVISFD